MKTLSKRERTLVGGALGVLVAVGIASVLFPAGPATKTRRVADERREHAQVLAELGQVRAEIEALHGRIERRVSPGTARQMVQEMIQSSQAAAKTAGLRMNDLKPVPAEDAGGVQRVPMQVSASAQFPQAVRFLYELERGNRQYHVDQLRITAIDPQSDRLEIELRMVAYVKGEGEEPNAAGS